MDAEIIHVSSIAQCASLPSSPSIMDNSPSSPNPFRHLNELWTGRQTPGHRWTRRRSEGDPRVPEDLFWRPLVEALMARVQWGEYYLAGWDSLCLVKCGLLAFLKRKTYCSLFILVMYVQAIFGLYHMRNMFNVL